jgi:hypothetical protein
VKALELAVHVGLWLQAAFFEFGLHFGSVPGLDTPGDVVDQTGDIRPIRASRCARVSGAISDDDAARIADLHRALLLAVVVNDLPSHQVAIERGGSPVVGDSVGDVIESHRLPRRQGARWRDTGFFRRLLRGRERSRSSHHAKRKGLDQLSTRQLTQGEKGAGEFRWLDVASVWFQFQIGNVNPLVVFLALPSMCVYTEHFGPPQFFTSGDIGCGYPCVSAVAMR